MSDTLNADVLAALANGSSDEDVMSSFGIDADKLAEIKAAGGESQPEAGAEAQPEAPTTDGAPASEEAPAAPAGEAQPE